MTRIDEHRRLTSIDSMTSGKDLKDKHCEDKADDKAFLNGVAGILGSPTGILLKETRAYLETSIDIRKEPIRESSTCPCGHHNQPLQAYEEAYAGISNMR